MDKFWEWMRANNYGYNWMSRQEYLIGACDERLWPTKQMLIGYKIEFLTDLKGKFNIGSVSSVGELNKELDSLIEQFTDKR